jgi:NAD(P)-dependent dehydrogenase (short-subunit alcohol dehydrogenase family)
MTEIDNRRLAGKTAFITGAASGIGRATAIAFATEGAKLALTDRDEAGLAVTAERCPGALTFVHDVTDEARWRAVVDAAVEALGRLDILVNCAGIAIVANIEATTLEDWRRVNAVNSDGTFLSCREAVRVMKTQGGGSIVNLSSVAGLIGDAQSAAYCASKGAVRLLTKSVAMYCARKGYGIRCNSVHPSFTATPMVEAVIARSKSPEKVREGLNHAAPMGRIGRPEEIAAAILYLASDESSFTTGAELVVDGGLTAQ